ncbi:MAG: hypothetical protein LAP21_16570 [Acidobacteriia bacterium]|nr:hypothetical protein [Terriglobia bacterium]
MAMEGVVGFALLLAHSFQLPSAFIVAIEGRKKIQQALFEMTISGCRSLTQLNTQYAQVIHREKCLVPFYRGGRRESIDFTGFLHERDRQFTGKRQIVISPRPQRRDVTCYVSKAGRHKCA